MTRVPVLLVGLGRIGFGYDADLSDDFVYSHARAFTRNPRFTLIGGVDPNGVARGRFTATTGVPAWADINDAPQTAFPQVVVIATPTELHADGVRRVLARWRPQVIVCEKPIAPSIQDGNSIVEACHAAGAHLLVNFIRRADPGVASVQSMIAAGEIAAPVRGVLWYSKGLLHNGSHLLDLATHWLGAWQDARVIRPDAVEPDIAVTFARGRLICIAAPEEHFSHYTMELVSPSGRLRYDRSGHDIFWQPAVPHPQLAGYRVLGEAIVISSGMPKYQAHVANQILTALEGRAHPLATGQEALQLQRQILSLTNAFEETQ
jgi:predicted dehydrogenase